MSAGTWRKRGALKLKRENDRLKRELNFATERQCTVQTVQMERVTAVGTLPDGVSADGPELPGFLRHVLAGKITDLLLDAGAIGFKLEDSPRYGRPAVRAELNIVKEA